MDSAIISEAGGCASGGLQMLLDRWRLQEEKLLDFEDSLKEVNKSMAYQPVQERREASNPETALQRKLSVIGGAVLGTSVQDRMIRVPSAQSMTSSDDDSGLSLRKGTYKGEEGIAMVNDESMEDFEKRIWGTVWKDEALLDDYVGDGSCTGAFSENYLQGEYGDMAPMPASVLLKNDLRGAENAVGKEFSPHSLFQQDFQGLPVRASPSTALSNDNFATPSGLEVRPQSSIHPCLDHVIMSHSFRSNPRTGTSESEGLRVLVGSESFPLASEKEESLEMAVNLVSNELWSSSQSNEDCSNLTELSTQRASFVESIMAAEAQRQMDREKEQLRRTEALKQEEEAAAASMERVLKNPLQLEQEEKQASIEEEACSRQQRVEELQRELESSNAHLKKLTENWNFFGKEIDLNTQSVAEYFKSRRLEEERRTTAAHRIARAFRKRKCRVLNNCCTSIQKVVRGFLCRQKVQELKGQRCKVMRVLTAAVEEGSVSMLIEISAEARKVGLHKELDVMKLEFARRRVARLPLSDETFQSQPSPQVQALLMEAGSMGLEEGKVKELLQSMAKSRDDALKCLIQVAEIGNWDEYESCLDRALALGLEEQVDAIQGRWEATKAEVSRWLQLVASSWGIGSRVVAEKLKEARRLGLTTLAEKVPAAMLEKESLVLAGLEASMMTGALKTFHEWLRSAKRFDMREAAEEYSARFRQRVVEVQQQLIQATVRNVEEKSVKQLLLAGSGFGLETEVAVVVRQIRRQILMFVKELIDRTKQSVSRGDDLLGKWTELRGRGKGFGLGAGILKDLLQSIESSVLLEHTKSGRSIFAMFECDSMGFPVSYDCETRRAFLSVTALTLRYSASSSEALESARKQYPDVGTGKKAIVRTLPLLTCCKSWHEVDRLRSRWKHQFSQPFLKVLASRNAAGGGLVSAKPPLGNGQCCTREGMNLGTVGGIQEALALERGHEDGDGDDEYWHTPRSPHGRGVQSLATCTLTRKMLEKSAQCNRTELRGVVKLSLTHEDLTSLGVGLLGRWCPKLRIFMMDENRLSSLKGAFHGCEGSLEYVLVKDNLLNDFKGLESLQNLKVLFLAGNFISYIGPGTEVHRDADVVDATAGTGPTKTTTTCGGSGVSMSSTPRASCRSWQGTPRFLEDRSDPRACLTSRNSLAHRARSLWPNLKKLCLGSNRIGRVWELGSLCPSLEVLDLGSNELVTLGGCEGRALAGLKNLRLLDVGQNKIKGRSLWKGLSHCPLLVSLVASRNRLTELPTHVGSVMLREIWLNGNSITSLACKAWLPNLQRFYLQENLIDNLESLWGCPSLEVLDISFNHLADLSQLRHLSSLRRLRTLQMNDNPVSDQEEHVDKVLEAVPWLTELDNEPVEDSLREKSVQSIFLKHMQVAGIQYLHEKVARGERPFLSFGNPREVAKQWLGSGSSFRSSTSDQFSWTSSAASAGHEGNSTSEAANRDIIETMHGKAKGAVLWAALFDLHRMAGTNPLLKAQLISPSGSDLHPLESLPCRSATQENWNCLAFQEMFESHRKSHSWSKETSLRKEFLVHEGRFGLQTSEKGGRTFGNDGIVDTPESHNVDPYLTDYLEHTDCKHQDVYIENLEYKIEMEDQLVKIRRLQALARGMLARKSHMRMQKLAIDALVARRAQRVSEKRRFRTSVLRIQAAWRGWVLRKAVRSATKLQAFWRGFVARKRYRQALCRLRYVDDDDFEYVAVDENEFLFDPVVLEDEYSLFCKLRPSEEPGIGYLCKQETAILATGSVKEDHEPSLRESHDTCAAPRVYKTGDMKYAALSENQSSNTQYKETGEENQSSKRAVDSCSRLHLTPESAKALFNDALRSSLLNEADASTVLQSKEHKTPLKETPLVTSRSGLQQCTTESSPHMKVHVCGKELQAEKKKAAIAEIAKEWGFHDEKTAESYMKARTRVQKMLEKKKAGHQGAQSRFEMFKARSEEALAHSPPQHTHVRRIVPRIPCKVERETVSIPSEDIALIDETLECWHPPAALPALVPHVRRPRLQKAKLRKSWPAWAAPSPGKLAMEVRDYAPEEEIASWDGWQTSLHSSLVANEADAHAGHRMFHSAADTKKHHRRLPFLAVLKKDATRRRR